MRKIQKKKLFSETNPGPYEIVIDKGAASLSDAQLLAAILRTGTRGEDATKLSQKVFDSSRTDMGLIGLCHMSIPELMEINGIGRVKAVQIQCIVELSRRIAKLSLGKRPDFSSPENIADYYMQDMMYLNKDRVVLALLDSKCRLVKDLVISIGSVNASTLSPRDIFIEVLKYKAVSFVLLHNHPSGDPRPSASDILITKSLYKGAKLLGVDLLDHIIIGNNTYMSFRQNCLTETKGF